MTSATWLLWQLSLASVGAQMLKGERLDRPTYAFLHTLDEGNTAVCYLMDHAIFGCKVVQKTVSMLGTPDAAAVVEPEVLRRVAHKRIVPVWEAQWDPSPQWRPLNAITFTSPFFEGGSIQTALLEGHRFGVGNVVKVADHVLQALDHMHVGHHLLHRDVKPGNVLLDDKRQGAYLGDLGSASYIDERTGGADGGAGSALYLAPEARRLGVMTVRSDLYSLGVTLTEMLNGRFLYETLDDDVINQRLAKGHRSLPDGALEPAPWIPKPLATFLRSLCNRRPEKRPEDAAAALRSLRALRVIDWERLNGEGLTGTWTGTWPPESRVAERRIHEVTIEALTVGKNKGMLRASARWRIPQGQWRGHASLGTLLDPTESSVAKFFRALDEKAHSAPTP